MKVGIDIQNCEGLKKFIGTEKMKKIFSPAEIDYIAEKNNNAETATGLYSAKEALFKAVGVGVMPSKLPDIEIAHKETGAPFYKLSRVLANELNVIEGDLSLSISHSSGVAVAVCIIYD
ncbi:MAG: 4'-phosphopantetheinyl transferase superfamily protein [Christensenellaceae bacterium]|jgi:phosphopantetheine--protein transferase-like protein|nr:4'-phosphopantetheinyl transferase superfamily protein [Christensenellaceae bacterium]